MYILAVASFIFSVFSCYFVRAYALKNSLLDVPNERSSHIAPTPRGGGAGIVFAYVISTVIFGIFFEVPLNLLITVSLPSIFVALVGFWDDHGDLSPKTRLICHFSAAFLFLYLVPKTGLYDEFHWSVTLVMFVLISFYFVWLLNLYNFMDGINGIASLEGVSVFFAIGVLSLLDGSIYMSVLAFILGAACFGFTVWNFPKAKLFMGDGGSGFLGIVIASIACFALASDPKYFWIVNIMLGVFIVDSTLTLFGRIYRKENVTKAHKLHAYQIASRKYQSHTLVTCIVFAINIFWLFPICFAVSASLINGFIATLIAWTPIALIVMALMKYEFGKPQ